MSKDKGRQDGRFKHYSKSESVTISDVSVLSRVARMTDSVGTRTVRVKMVQRLSGWSKKVGSILLMSAEERKKEEKELRQAAENIERAVGVAR